MTTTTRERTMPQVTAAQDRAVAHVQRLLDTPVEAWDRDRLLGELDTLADTLAGGVDGTGGSTVGKDKTDRMFDAMTAGVEARKAAQKAEQARREAEEAQRKADEARRAWEQGS